jgi:translation initiation factor IF-2
MLAIASKGLIIGFNTDTERGAQRLADIEGVSIRNYEVIYNLVDDVSKALKGMLEPSYIDVIDGRTEVRAIFTASKKRKIAGVYVTEGKISRGASVKVKRQGRVICESTVSSLKHIKDDVKEMNAGSECGVGTKDCNDFQVGDILEVFRRENR